MRKGSNREPIRGGDIFRRGKICKGRPLETRAESWEVLALSMPSEELMQEIYNTDAEGLDK